MDRGGLDSLADPGLDLGPVGLHESVNTSATTGDRKQDGLDWPVTA